MFRTLTATVAALALLSLSCADAQAATRKAAKKKKPAAEPVVATNDNLDAAQLAEADRVLTGAADCEFKQKVSVEKIAGHQGNFKVTFDHKSYVMVPVETTTGAVRLVDTGGAVTWIQIPTKSMLMNQKEHHRLVDNCLEDEQRIAVEASQKAGANADILAPAVSPAVAAALANGSTVSTVTTTRTDAQVLTAAPGASAPAASK